MTTRSSALFRPVLFYALAFAIAWSAWTPLLLHKLDVLRLPIPFIVALFIGQTLGAFAPLLALLVIQKISDDRLLVRRVFRQLRFRGVSLGWFIAPAVIPIGLTLSITALSGLVSDGTIAVLRPEPIDELGWGLLAVIPFQFLLGMIGSPLGEEPGWRGYVLDGFARNGRVLIGSGVVACFWWIWHLPLFVVLGVDPTAYTFVSMAGHSLLIDSLFLLSKRNLLVAMIYHQGINTSFMFLISSVDTIRGSAVLLLIALATRTAVHRIARHDTEANERDR